MSYNYLRISSDTDDTVYEVAERLDFRIYDDI